MTVITPKLIQTLEQLIDSHGLKGVLGGLADALIPKIENAEDTFEAYTFQVMREDLNHLAQRAD